MCLNMGGAAPLIVGKQIKAVATLSRSRSPLMPDLPTAHERGLTDFDVVTWNAFFLPKGAPKEIVKKLNDATSQAMDTPAIRACSVRFDAQQGSPLGLLPSPLWGGLGAGVGVGARDTSANYDPHPARLRCASAGDPPHKREGKDRVHC